MIKKMRYNKLMTIFILTCCSLTIAKSDRLFEDTIIKTYQVENGGTLTIDSNLGEIDVKGVKGNQVQIKIIRQIKAESQRAANQILEYLDIDTHQQTQDVVIYAKYHQPKNQFFKWIDGSHRWPNLRFIITVPTVYHLDLITEDGDITISQIQGNVYCSTSDGDVLVEDITGPADIKTSDGNVQIENVNGPVAVKTSDGNILLDECSESVDLKTSDGDIRVNWVKGDVIAYTSDGHIAIQETKGAVTAKTSDGDIEVNEFGNKIEAITSDGSITAKIKNQPKEDCRLKTSDGSIRVYISDGINLTINAKSHDGRIKTDFPVKIVGEVDKNRLYTQINSGGPEINLLSSDGSIHLIKL